RNRGPGVRAEALVEEVRGVYGGFLRKIELGDVARLAGAHVEMDVRRAVADWRIIAAWLDRHDPPLALGIGAERGIALEIGVKRRSRGVARVVITPGRIGLPQLDLSAGDGIAANVENTSGHFDDL